MSSKSTPTTIVPPNAEDDEYFPRGSLRNSTSLRVVDSSTHVVVATTSAHQAIVEDDEEYGLDTNPPTPGDPFMTPAASVPGSTYNLASGTASRLSIHSPMYNFGDIANAGSRRSLESRRVKHSSTDITDAPPVPALPTSLTRASRSYAAISELAPGSPTATHFSKRESFQAPPPMQRPASAGLGVPSHVMKRLSAQQRPSTSGTTSSTRSATDLSPPQSSSGSVSEKDPIRSVAFHLEDITRAMKGGGGQKRMRSSMLTEDEEVPKPWVTAKSTRARLSYWLTFGVALLGIVASFFRIFYGVKTVQLLEGNLCMVLNDDFNGPEIDKSVWSWEVEMDGFGNGEFEMMTNSPNNSFIEDGILYLVPTLTSDVIGTSAIFDGYTFNISGCTAANSSGCGAVSNVTTRTVINPVQSARLTTVNSTSIQYGRVEIRAKNPAGDWLWPALWMLPLNNTYGPWPISGEIDIMESRGNDRSYPAQGRDFVRSSLNWGPLTWLNEVSKTFGWWNSRRRSYDQDFHVYALEWSDKFIRAYVDSRLRFMLDITFNEPFFTRGDFPTSVFNGSQEIPVPDPWGTDNFAAPFDQPFYLIMDLAVGGTNGWFPDNLGNKPWLDQSQTAMYDFARAQDTWYGTWPQDVHERALAVDYVKMWQLC